MEVRFSLILPMATSSRKAAADCFVCFTAATGIALSVLKAFTDFAVLFLDFRTLRLPVYREFNEICFRGRPI